VTPQSQPELLYQPEETGAYVAPPLAGAARGPTSRVGFESGSITFPELRLRLPHFELPSIFRSRSNARMLYEAGEAPWQTTGVTNALAAQNVAILQQQVAALQQQLAATTPAAGPSEAQTLAAKDAAEKFLAANQDELQRLRCEVNRLRALEQCLRDVQQRGLESKDCTNGGRLMPTPQQAPLRPPVPPAALHQHVPAAVYPAQPAAYLVEPAVNMPLAAGTIREPQPALIHEPRAAITGMRTSR
jgi:hypothetical protein